MAQDPYSNACSIGVGSYKGVSIIKIAGEVDTATVSLLAKALSDAIHSGSNHVILDAQDLTFIDSSGIQTLLSAHSQLSTKDRSLAIVGCHGIFHRLISICMLQDHFSMYQSIEDAVALLTDQAA